MVLMKIVTLQATNPGKGMDCLGLDSSFGSSGFNQEMPDIQTFKGLMRPLSPRGGPAPRHCRQNSPPAFPRPSDHPRGALPSRLPSVGLSFLGRLVRLWDKKHLLGASMQLPKTQACPRGRLPLKRLPWALVTRPATHTDQNPNSHGGLWDLLPHPTWPLPPPPRGGGRLLSAGGERPCHPTGSRRGLALPRQTQGLPAVDSRRRESKNSSRAEHLLFGERRGGRAAGAGDGIRVCAPRSAGCKSPGPHPDGSDMHVPRDVGELTRELCARSVGSWDFVCFRGGVAAGLCGIRFWLCPLVGVGGSRPETACSGSFLAVIPPPRATLLLLVSAVVVTTAR